MIDGEFILFVILSVAVIAGAVLMISFTKVVHMVTSLAFVFLGLAAFYIMLGAELVAMVQVLIYAGAISILMIFGIMMTKHHNGEGELRRKGHQYSLLIGCLALFGLLFYAIRDSSFPEPIKPISPEHNTLEIGKLLYNDYVLAFELISVLLTVAFIGAIILAKREEE